MIFLGDSDIRPLSGDEGQSCPGCSAKDLFEKFIRKSNEVLPVNAYVRS
jgi:hypothetical protein